MKQLKIITLGALQIRIEGQNLDLGTRKQRALLALLVINRRRAVSVDRIIVALWGPDAAPEHRRDVWVYISRLRKSLGPFERALRREPGGYVLDIEDALVDAVQFEALVEEGRRLLPDDPAAASLVFGEALAAWSGGAYEEFVTDEFATPEIARLEESRLMALEMRIQADLAWREADELIPEIEGLTQSHPQRPNLTGSLMLALYRRGRQADALRAYDRFATRLADESGLPPPEDLRVLEEQILLDDPASRAPTRDLRTGLPERIARFIGREEELKEVTQLISAHRLVTITGFGGVGKSALALEAARRLALGLDVVAFIDLIRAERAETVMSVISEALRVRLGTVDGADALIDRIGDRRVLLVMDNCESLAAQAAQTIMVLLQGAAGLRVLATSRVVLGITGEHLVRLAPLSTAKGENAEILLRERIADLPSSTRNTINDNDVRSLCVKTEGIPLAIELAAAQLRAWSAEEVLAALDQPLEALVSSNRVGPGHQGEMAANIAWSERLLPPLAQTLLSRLSVFRSSFSFDAAVQIVGIDPLTAADVRLELHRLVDASLVSATPGSPSRYRMLEPVRQYAAHRLSETSEADAIAGQHLRCFADLFLASGSSIEMGTDDSALERARPDDANLLAAIWWAIEQGDSESAHRLTASAIPFWRATANISDYLPTIDTTLGMTDSPTRVKAELLFQSIPLYILGRSKEAVTDQLVDLESCARDLSDPEVTAWLKLRRADAAVSASGRDRVIDMYGEAVASLRACRSRYVLNALHQLGWYQYWCWDRWKETEATIAQWRELAITLESHNLGPEILHGWFALAQRDVETSEEVFTNLSIESRGRADHLSAALQMLPLSISSLQRGDVAEAGRRIDVAVVATRGTGTIPWIQNSLITRSYVKTALGDERGAVADLMEVVTMERDGAGPAVAAELATATAAAVADSHPDSAATLLGVAESLPAGNHMQRMGSLLAEPALKALDGEAHSGVPEATTARDLISARVRKDPVDAASATAMTIAALNEASCTFR